jgi:hypothetical protein
VSKTGSNSNGSSGTGTGKGGSYARTNDTAIDLSVTEDATLLFQRAPVLHVITEDASSSAEGDAPMSAPPRLVRRVSIAGLRPGVKSGFHGVLGDTREFEFAECVASNPEFDKKTGSGHTSFIYIPVGYRCRKTGSSRLQIRRVDVRMQEDVTITEVELIGENRFKGATCYGCRLTNSGILWMCLFDIDTIVGYDLVDMKVQYQFVSSNKTASSSPTLSSHS